MPDPNQNYPNQPGVPAVSPGIVPITTDPAAPVSQTAFPMPTDSDIPPIPASPDNSTDSRLPVGDSSQTGSASPNDMPPMIAGPKKKFGGGRVIATILGLFLLIGGIGAGIFLVKQNQDIRERATPGEPPLGCEITPPTNINVTNITANSATLNWTSGTGGNYVKLWVSSNSGGNPTADCGRLSNKIIDSVCVANENGSLIDGDSNHADIPATPNIYQVTGMTLNTKYYWRIMMWKESGCDYAAPTVSFTTTAVQVSTPTPTASLTPTPTPTPTSTPTAISTSTPGPSATPNGCNGTCGSNFNCQGSLLCYNGYCRNPSCTTNTNCTCSGTPGPVATATPVPPTLPQSGVDWPTIFGAGIGIFTIIGALILAI